MSTVRRVLLLLITGVQAWACVCAAHPSVKQAWEASSAVFVGFVETATSLGPNPFQTTTVKAEECFKGCRNRQVFVLKQPGHDCAPRFKEGKRVLFYLNPSSIPNAWEAFGCSRTNSVEFAADDLLFLRALPGSAQKNRLAGEIALYENSVNQGFRFSHPLAGIHVHVRSENYSKETVTNDDGVYELYDAPPAQYTIAIDVPQRMRIKFPTIAGGEDRRDEFKDLNTTEPIVRIGAASAADVDFVLMVDNQISGRVLDATGKPPNDICVGLTPATGEASPYFNIYDCPKTDGSFNLKDMPAGQYLIYVEKWADGRRQKPVLFYPGTFERNAAVAIKIGNGEHQTGFDFQMTK